MKNKQKCILGTVTNLLIKQESLPFGLYVQMFFYLIKCTVACSNMYTCKPGIQK